jgi:hypothetical protein
VGLGDDGAKCDTGVTRDELLQILAADPLTSALDDVLVSKVVLS